MGGPRGKSLSYTVLIGWPGIHRDSGLYSMSFSSTWSRKWTRRADRAHTALARIALNSTLSLWISCQNTHNSLKISNSSSANWAARSRDMPEVRQLASETKVSPVNTQPSGFEAAGCMAEVPANYKQLTRPAESLYSWDKTIILRLVHDTGSTRTTRCGSHRFLRQSSEVLGWKNASRILILKWIEETLFYGYINVYPRYIWKDSCETDLWTSNAPFFVWPLRCERASVIQNFNCRIQSITATWGRHSKTKT